MKNLLFMDRNDYLVFNIQYISQENLKSFHLLSAVERDHHAVMTDFTFKKSFI